MLLPYMIAIALLDDQVMPEQYEPERIMRPDVQALLRKIVVRPVEEYSRRFPGEMPCRVAVSLDDGESVMIAKQDYEGFHSRPMRWESVVQKFEQLSARYADAALRREIIEAVSHLDTIHVTDLTHRLAVADKNQPPVGSNQHLARHAS